MNPKDMTNYDLVSKGLWATFSNGVNDGRGRKRSAEHTELTDVLDVELLRRLDERDQYKSQWENCNSDYRFAVAEADALRKENEELRRDAERYRFIRDNADTIAINSSLQYCDIFRSEGIEEELDIAMKFESDYATSEKTKESEASHES